MPTFTADKLREIGIRIFEAAGASEREAERVTELLVKSNLAGHDSHGFIRVPRYIEMIREGEIVPGAKTEVVRETPATVVLDGNWGFGQVTATESMEIAIERAEQCAVSSIGVHNCNHVGRLADYPEMASKQDMVGMMTVNDHGVGRLVAPWGGIARRYAPNPISFAIPREQEAPILLDISTSVVAEGKLRVKRNRGEQTPEGWIIDSEGRPTTDPNDFYDPPEGALLPMGGIVGYKGYGLGLVLDILAGALTGAGCSRPEATRLGNGILIIVLDIKRFVPLDTFKQQVEDFVAYVKSSPTAPGFGEILVPGDVELREMKRRSREGIPIEETTWEQIVEAARSVGLSVSL